MARISKDQAELDLTPMIDVVFQLIIFFIVTIKMNEQINKEIVLEDAPYGPVIEEGDTSTSQRTLIIEVDRRGRISIQNVPVNRQQLHNIVSDRFKRYRDAFSIMIRGDYEAQHKDIRSVMDVCSGIGIWRLNFVAVQEHKQTTGRHQGPPGYIRR